MIMFILSMRMFTLWKISEWRVVSFIRIWTFNKPPPYTDEFDRDMFWTTRQSIFIMWISDRRYTDEYRDEHGKCEWRFECARAYLNKLIMEIEIFFNRCKIQILKRILFAGDFCKSRWGYFEWQHVSWEYSSSRIVSSTKCGSYWMSMDYVRSSSWFWMMREKKIDQE